MRIANQLQALIRRLGRRDSTSKTSDNAIPNPAQQDDTPMLRNRHRILVLSLLAVTIAAVPAVASADDHPTNGRARATRPAAQAVIRDVNGAYLGTMTFVHRQGKVTVQGKFVGVAPGFHGIHIHAVGTCDPKAKDQTGAVAPFQSAGGHLNPGNAVHGHHAGDLPPLLVAADGTAFVMIDIGGLPMSAVFDVDRSAVILHAGPDNLANIPNRYTAAGSPGPDAATQATGDSGARVGCGVIIRPAGAGKTAP